MHRKACVESDGLEGQDTHASVWNDRGQQKRKRLGKDTTTMMTKSVEVHRKLDRHCTRETRRHVQLMGGKARDAAIYPKAFCRAVCQEVARQMVIDALDLVSFKCQVSDLIAVDGV